MTSNTNAIITGIATATSATIVTWVLASKKLGAIADQVSHVAPRAQRLVSKHTNTVLYLFIAAMVAYVGFVSHAEDSRNRQINAVLCVFRSDLQNKITSEDLELNHPFEFGTTPAARALVLNTIHSQQTTLDALKGLKCD